MRKKPLISNHYALSIVQDTLLFLVFISISALILSPNIIQSGVIHERYDDLYELNVQQSLLALLDSNNHKFYYKTGSEPIDAIANKIGIDTKENQSLYHRISSHFLEKEQYHKSIRQLISENLFTQYKFQFQNNTIALNPFSGNAEKALSQLIRTRLNKIIPSYFNYNFSANWYPFDGISFGGNISLGNPIPKHSSTYSAHQEITLPILPCVKFGNSSFCFHSSYFKRNLDYLIENVDCIHNLSILCNHKENNQSYEKYDEKITNNLSELIQVLFIDGIRTESDEILIPSAYDLISSYLFSELYCQNINTLNKNEERDSFHYLDSFFSFHSNDYNMINDDISSLIISDFGNDLQKYIKDNLYSTAQDLSIYLKEQLSSLLKPVTINLSNLIAQNIISNSSFNCTLEKIIDACFYHISLTSASVSLTMWRE